MKPLGATRRHYWLSQRMAQATGADPASASRADRLSGAEWADMVQRCRGCDWTEGCVRWLRNGPRATTAPAPCRNRASLAVLRLEAELDASSFRYP